jgi:hypothetical protein
VFIRFETPFEERKSEMYYNNHTLMLVSLLAMMQYRGNQNEYGSDKRGSDEGKGLGTAKHFSMVKE